MKIFVTASFKGNENKTEIENLCSMVKNAGFEVFCFARDGGVFDNSKEMMDKAESEIEKCDALLFDATEKSTGRAIEVGIAFANKKKIIVIMKEGTLIKDTLKGVADVVITYNQIEDIQDNLRNDFLKWTGK